MIAGREFYVYEHWRPDKGLPFYVGKGRGGRAAFLNQRSRHHSNIQIKLKREGLAVEVRRVFDGLDEEMAFSLEKAQIAYWRTRGVVLLNKTDGGEGTVGFNHTRETRAALSDFWTTPEARAWRAAKTKEVMARPGMRARASEIQKVVQNLPEVVVKRQVALEKFWATPGVREQRGAALKVAFADPEIRARMSAAQKLAKNTPEARANASRAQKKISQERPEVRERTRVALKATLALPETKARYSAIQKIAQNRPDVLARQSVAQKEAQNRPEVRAKRSASAKIAQNRPGAREKNSAAVKVALANPEVAAKRRAAIQASWEDPDKRAKRIAASKATRERKKNNQA